MADPGPPPHAQQPNPVAPGPAPLMPSGGGAAWGVGLLALVPFPIVAPILTGILMAAIGRSQGRDGRVAAVNGRNAGNWGLTYTILSIILWTAHSLLLFLLTRDGPARDFFPIGTALTLWVVLTIVHVVLCIRGMLRAKRREVFAVPSFPLLRH
jgi:hypothetical protein